MPAMRTRPHDVWALPDKSLGNLMYTWLYFIYLFIYLFVVILIISWEKGCQFLNNYVFNSQGHGVERANGTCLRRHALHSPA